MISISKDSLIQTIEQYLLKYGHLVHFPTEELIKITAGIAIALIPDTLKNSTVFLMIVDTWQAKFGDHFDCYFQHFDHAAKTGNSYLPPMISSTSPYTLLSLHLSIKLKSRRSP